LFKLERVEEGAEGSHFYFFLVHKNVMGKKPIVGRGKHKVSFKSKLYSNTLNTVTCNKSFMQKKYLKN
jgi:hypothetical protein